MPKIRVNEPCFCGSGRKYKKCHREKESVSKDWFYSPPDISEAYKFFRSEDEQYANNMVDRGEILIGTLDYYRTIELKSLERSDPSEGIKKVYTD